MATQSIVDRLQVEYVKVLPNGGTEKLKGALIDLVGEGNAEARKDILALAILPLYNKDGSLYTRASDISQYIKDFPNLQTLVYPIQFDVINISGMQKTCPSLQKFLRTIPEGYIGEVSPITLKGRGNTTITETPSDDNIQTFGNLVGDKSNLYSIIDIAPKVQRTPSAKKSKPNFITYQNVLDAISTIGERLDEIERKVNAGNSSQLTKTKIQNMLKNAVGRITQDELDNIIGEIRKGIDFNIPNESMEDLEKNINTAIKVSFAQIYERIKSEENRKYSQLLSEIAVVKQFAEDEVSARAKVLELLQNKFPDLIATNRTLTDKLFVELGKVFAQFDSENPNGIRSAVDSLDVNLIDILTRIDTTNAKINDIQSQSRRDGSRLSRISENFDKLLPLITQKFSEVGASLVKMNSGINSSNQELKTFITETFGSFAQGIREDFQNDNREFFVEIANKMESIPSIDEIRGIVDQSLEGIKDFSAELKEEIVQEIVDTVIEKMGDLSKLDEIDLSNIKTVIHDVISSEHFKQTISNIITTQNSLIESSMNDINDRLTTHDEVIKASLAGLSDKLDGLAKKSDIESLLSRDQDGNLKGLIVDLLRDELSKQGVINKQQLEDFKSSIIEDETFRSLVENSGKILEFIKNSSVDTTEDSETDEVSEVCKKGIKVVVKNYITSTDAARESLGQTYRLVADGERTPQYQDPNNLTRIVRAVISELGHGNQPSNNPEYEELKHQLEEYKKQLNDIAEKLKHIVAKFENSNTSTSDPVKPDPTNNTTTQTSSTTPVIPVTPTPSTTQPGPTSQTPKKPTVIEAPKPTGTALLVSGTIKHLKKLKEPKLSAIRRFGKFIIRRPLAAAAIGLGIGALGAAGAVVATSLITTGGLAGLTTMGFLSNPIMFGAGIGAGTMLLGGVVGGIVVRKSGKTKRERLYTKFLKQKAQCDALAKTIEKKHQKAQERQQKLEELKEKQRSGNKLLKKLGVYKIAKNHNRKKLKKLTQKARILENKRVTKVNEALSTKQDLNAMEENSGKTVALGGELQKLRSKKAEIQAKIANALSEEEKEDLQEDLKNVIEDAETAVEGISKVSDEFKTFDKEAEELITSVKGKQTGAMKNILQEIQNRNAKRKLSTEERPVFDDTDVSEYATKTATSGSDVEKQKAQKLQQYMQSLKSDKSNMANLVRDGKLKPELASKLAREGEVELTPADDVDVDFKELPSDDKEK